jgi:arylsulfatase A-like enzyme
MAVNRRDLLRVSALAARMASGAGAPAPAARPKQAGPSGSARREMPNILWVCSDQQRFDTIAGLNNQHVRTPHLRQFMAEAATFTHAFVQSPVCTPSRASFLTGRYPHITGARMNGTRIRPTERLVTRVLADFGYTCGLAGKLHLSPCSGGKVEDRIDDGYSRFWWSHDLQDIWPGHNMWHVWLQSQGVTWPKPPSDPWGVPVDPKYTQAAWCADRAIQFMREQRGFGPWLMSVNMFQPHHPFLPAKEYLDRYDPEKLPSPAYKPGELDSKPPHQRSAHNGTAYPFSKLSDLERRKITAAYYAMIEQVDHEFGRMLKDLGDTGQADNTIVIFMSDHGEMLGDHGFYLKGCHFYDCSMRVPLMIRWPKRFSAGLKTDALVEMVDIVPTLLEAAGIPVIEGIQGRSLTALLEGKTEEHRDSVYMESYSMPARREAAMMATSVRTRTHKMTVYHSMNTGELYDLRKDPGEFRNLWDDPGSRSAKEEMMARLVARMSETVDPLPVQKSPW